MSKKIVAFTFCLVLVFSFGLTSKANVPPDLVQPYYSQDIVCDIPVTEDILDSDITGEFDCQFIGYSTADDYPGYRDEVVYLSACSDSEIVVYLHSDILYSSQDCFGFLTEANDSVVYSIKETYWNSTIDSYYTHYWNNHDHEKVKNQYTDLGVPIMGTSIPVNANDDYTNLRNIVLKTNVKVFDTYNNALQYFVDGSLNGLIDDGLDYDPNDIAFTSFKVIPHENASFDNFYFEFRYELSPYVRQHLDNSKLIINYSYEGSLLVEREFSGILGANGSYDSFAYGPFYSSFSGNLSTFRSGFPSFIKDYKVFDEYFSSAFPKSSLYLNNQRKMQILGYGSWQKWDVALLDEIYQYKPASSLLSFNGYIEVNGVAGKPFTFRYDFLKGQGDIEYTPWDDDPDSPDEPVIEPVAPDPSPAPDGGSSGGGISNNIDIDISVGGDGSSPYMDVNPEDYNNFMESFRDSINELNTDGETFHFLENANKMLPAEIWKIIGAGLAACILISLIVILRR